VPKYNLTISFEVDRLLNKDELDLLEHNAFVQIDDPANEEGDTADFKTNWIVSNMEEISIL
jgi:hypothetical protein